MALLIPLIERVLVFFGSATVGYHLCLLFRWPAWALVPCFGLSVGLAAWCPGCRRGAPPFVCGRGLSLATAALAVLVTSGVLALRNPNPDDSLFFHRALAQLDHLREPIFTTDTLHGVAGLPPLSTTHVLSSYEPLVAIVSAAAGLDPLQTYHNLMAAWGTLLLLGVSIALYREFGLSPALAVAATAASIVFMLVDLRLDGRSFGNILLYLWIGKVMLWGVALPATLLVAHRYLRRPSSHRFAVVALAAVGGAGLSGSGLFLIPALLACCSVAYVASSGFTGRRLRRAMLLNVASAYNVLLLLGLALGWLPVPADTSAWSEGWPQTWWQNLGLLVHGRSGVCRDLLVLLLLPPCALGRASAGFLVALVAALVVLFANPIMGPLWLHALTPGAYWRLLFLLPLPWFAGLIAAALRRQRMAARLAASAAIASIAFARWLQPAGPVSHVGAKLPWSYRLPARELAFSDSLRWALDGKTLLAPESMSVVLALVDRRVRFDSTRGSAHTFRNADREGEGTRRLAAQAFVDCGGSPAAEQAFLEASTRVDGIVLRECSAGQVGRALALLEGTPSRWTTIARNNGYVGLLRQ